jgi:hypothetical protein
MMLFPQVPAAIRTCPIPGQLSLFHVHESDTFLKSHSAYQDAKSGNAESAIELVGDLAWDALNSYKKHWGRHCIFVAPHAKELRGENAIPQVLAAVCAVVCGATVDLEIVQTTRVFHTGADPMERLVSRPEFHGEVVSGAHYVLIDDVTNLGGTLAELSHYIQIHGGVVQSAFVLVNAGRKKSLQPDPRAIRLISSRFGNEIVQIFGIQPHALTRNEASYLVGFRSSVEIRNRVVKARQEIHLRLRSKGISHDVAI